MVMSKQAKIESRKIAKYRIFKKSIFQKSIKNGSDQVLYTVFHAEFESGSRIGPKPPQDPILTDF